MRYAQRQVRLSLVLFLVLYFALNIRFVVLFKWEMILTEYGISHLPMIFVFDLKWRNYYWRNNTLASQIINKLLELRREVTGLTIVVNTSLFRY